MRRLSIAFLGLAACLAPSDATAQDLTAGPVELTLGGRLHLQSAEGVGEDDVFVRRARLRADIGVTDWVSIRIQPEYANEELDEFQDLYVRLNFPSGLRLSVGQFKRAFDLFELSSSTDLSIIERDGRVGAGSCTGVGGTCSYSRLTEKLGFAGRDRGIKAEFSRGRWGFMGTVSNGAGINVGDENDSKSFAGRVSYDLTGDLTVSGQFGAHDYIDATGDDAHAPAWSADLQYGDWRDGWLIQAATAVGDNWKASNANGGDPMFRVYQAVASYYHAFDGMAVAGVEPLLRISYADPDTDTADDGGWIFTPGAMLYIRGRNKIGFNLDVFSPSRGDTETSFKIQAFVYR